MEVTVRKMQPGEAEQVAALEKACFTDPWSEKSLRSQLGNPHALYLVAELEGRIVGYIGTQLVLDEGDILRVAIEEDRRGQKIGSAILQYLLEVTPEIRIWNLDVREHNLPAVGLYRKFGFEAIGRRKRYYHHPEEDAILMQMRRGED